MRAIGVFFLSIFVVLLSGCSVAELSYDDGYIFGQDAQIGFNNPFGYGIAENGSGYYFCSGPNLNFLYFYDTEKKKAVPACNKPDCLHADETDPYKIPNCNAFVGSCQYLSYYMGSMYYSTAIISPTEIYDSIIQILPDGSRKTILDFPGSIRQMKIHRGFIYFSTADLDTVPAEDFNKIKSIFRLYRFELEKPGAKPDIIEQGEQITGMIGAIVCYGNDVYYSVQYMQDDRDITILKKYNILTKTVSTVMEDAPYFTIFSGNIVYYHDWATYACGLDGKTQRKISDAKGLLYANSKHLFIDNDYYSFMEEHILTVIDTNWNTVKAIPMKEIKDIAYGCSEEFFFVPGRMEYTEFGPSFSMYCIPVDKTPEEMALQLLHEFVPKVPFQGVKHKQ